MGVVTSSLSVEIGVVFGVLLKRGESYIKNVGEASVAKRASSEGVVGRRVHDQGEVEKASKHSAADSENGELIRSDPARVELSNPRVEGI